MRVQRQKKVVSYESFVGFGAGGSPPALQLRCVSQWNGFSGENIESLHERTLPWIAQGLFTPTPPSQTRLEPGECNKRVHLTKYTQHSRARNIEPLRRPEQPPKHTPTKRIEVGGYMCTDAVTHGAVGTGERKG